MLKWLSSRPDLQCKQIKKNGYRCRNPRHYGCKTCRFHGSRRIRTGVKATAYKTGEWTAEAIKNSQEVRARLGVLQKIGEKFGFLPKKRGRKIVS
jgi:hypothetical protein